MRRDERGRLLAYRFATIPDDRVSCLVSTRRGGFSTRPYSSLNLGFRDGDNADFVLVNRRRFFDTYELPLEDSVWCRQVHGNNVVRVGAGDRGRGALDGDGAVEDADALITDEVGMPICVLVADCVPVVIYDPAHHVIGLAHAGWRGTVSRICGATVRAMTEAWGSRPEELIAAIGPSIAPDDYEVGDDVVGRAREAFGDQVDEVIRTQPDGRTCFDLWAANALDLREAGVPEDAIETAGLSTAANLDQFYSHRAEQETGRFAAIAQLL